MIISTGQSNRSYQRRFAQTTYPASKETSRQQLLVIKFDKDVKSLETRRNKFTTVPVKYSGYLAYASTSLCSSKYHMGHGHVR